MEGKAGAAGHAFVGSASSFPETKKPSGKEGVDGGGCAERAHELRVALIFPGMFRAGFGTWAPASMLANRLPRRHRA